MSFLKRVKPEVAKKAKVAGPRAERKSIDLSLTKSLGNGVYRDVFKFSNSMMEKLGLESKSIAPFEGPEAIVVVKENSPLALAMLSKGEKSKKKSPAVSLPELVTALEKAGTIVEDRQPNYKAEFSLVEIEQGTEEYNAIVAAADELGGDIEAVYKLVVGEIGTFEPRKRKAKVDGDEVPADAFTAVEPTSDTSQGVVEEVYEETPVTDNDDEPEVEL